MSSTKVLILGGTSEARALAARLDELGIAFVSSLAGRVSRPRLPVGDVRIGGFGGVAGLTATLRDDRFTHVVDATHPFAVTMRSHAVAACAAADVPLVRLARPGWREHPDASTWHWVSTYAGARALVDAQGWRRPFVTTGRQTLEHYRGWDDKAALVRIVEPLDIPAPPAWTVLHTRGPFDVDTEIATMREHAVDVVLTKDSGGSYTAAKLTAARQLGVPVVVVARPAAPAGLREVSTLDEVVTFLRS